MNVRCSGFLVPRSGHSAEQCEDALWPAGAHSQETERFRASVTDGASEGFLAGLWARLLAESVAEHGDFDRRLAAAVERWTHETQAFAQRRPLQWFEEAALARGAAAALLDLELVPGRWTATSVGDVCLFQVHDEDVLGFPMSDPADFGCTPALVPSRLADLGDSLSRARGTWAPGDLFLVATDALSAWFLQELDRGGRPWELLRDLQGAQEFAEWVAAEREASRLKDDDVAMMRLHVDG